MVTFIRNPMKDRTLFYELCWLVSLFCNSRTYHIPRNLPAGNIQQPHQVRQGKGIVHRSRGPLLWTGQFLNLFQSLVVDLLGLC